MIDGLKHYPEYRDSGNPVLGRVPTHWDVARLGTLGQFLKGSGGNKDDEVPEGIPCVRYGDLYTQYDNFIWRTRSCVAPGRAVEYTPIRRGDVLFAASGETIEEIGKSAVVLMDTPIVAGGDVIILRPSSEVVPGFMGYALGSPCAVYQKSRMGRGVTVMHVYPNALKNLGLAMPPPDEQRAIARFLDHADRLIRRYIATKQKLIKLLEEERRAIIQQAALGGDSIGAEVARPSVEWWPEIPVSHRQVDLRRVSLSIRDGTHNPPPAVPGEHRLLSVRNIIGGEFVTRPDDRTMSPEAFADLARSYTVRPGDIVLALVGATTGKSALVRQAENVSVQRSLGIVRPDARRVDVRFLHMVLQSYLVQGQIQQEMTKYAAQPGIYLDEVGRLRIPVPSIAMQKAAVQWAQGQIQPLDLVQNQVASEISLLREIRTRLVADVVTGKLDVCEAAASLPDPVEADELPDIIGDADEADEDALKVPMDEAVA